MLLLARPRPLAHSPALLWVRRKDGAVFGTGGNRHRRVLVAAAHNYLPRHRFRECALQFRREAQALCRIRKFCTVKVMSGYHFSSNSRIEKTVSGFSRLMLVWPPNRYDAFSRRSTSEACMAALDAGVTFMVSMKSARVGIGCKSVF